MIPTPFYEEKRQSIFDLKRAAASALELPAWLRVFSEIILLPCGVALLDHRETESTLRAIHSHETWSH